MPCFSPHSSADTRRDNLEAYLKEKARREREGEEDIKVFLKSFGEAQPGPGEPTTAFKDLCLRLQVDAVWVNQLLQGMRQLDGNFNGGKFYSGDIHTAYGGPH